MFAMELAQPGPAGTGGPLRAVERPAPVPGPGEVLVDVSACAVCRTDLQIAEGDLAARQLPIIPGHQIVGRVAAHGPGVDTAAIPVGSRVGIAWIASTCGRCRFCTTGRENLCVDLGFTGWSRDGGFAEQVTAGAGFVHRLPDHLDDVQAAPLLCGGAVGYRSLAIAGIDVGSSARHRERGPAPGSPGSFGGSPGSGAPRLGLYGFGASATCVIQLARHLGCRVFVATRSAREQARARRLGAEWAGGYDEAPPEPLDAAITFAPAGDVVIAALAAVDRGAPVAINAIHLDRIPQFDYDLLWLERSLRSVANVTRADVADFLALAAEVPVRTEVEVLPLADANVALHRLARGKISGAAVLTHGGT